ncbi:MAG: hypothetical protein HZB42_04130 [Sphingobacteriales bacterium]|nr:hypothetical protein [Sphingobacteriales bacterium]
MRFFLSFLILFPLVSAAQDSTAGRCKLNRETDPFTKETKISTGFFPLDGGSVTIDATSAEIDFLFSIEGSDRCFDNNSTAAIFFEGPKLTKFNTRNGGSMNCEGLFHFVFKNTATPNTLLSRMMTQKINHILFTGNNKKEATINLTPNDQQALMALVTCLVNEAKGLIK